jgi:peptide/nickel transport system ATP-binding protein
VTSTIYNDKDEVLLQLNNVRLNFHTYAGEVKALDGVTFTVRKGEVLGLVGESGCGKSVTALAIVGLLPENGHVYDGEILFEGRNLRDLDRKEMQNIRRYKIAMVFQDPTTFLNPVLTIREQLEEVLTPDRVVPVAGKTSENSRSEDEQSIETKDETARVQTPSKPKKVAHDLFRALSVQALKQVKLADPERILGQYPHQLSGGMRQRCMIAMAFARNPSLFIADEITTALDVTVQAQILELLRELKNNLLGSTLLITHDLGIVAELCDRAAVMYAGNIVELAEVNELFANPLHPYTQGLMRSIPVIGRRTKRLETIPGSVPDLIYPPTGCRFHPRCPFAFNKCKDEKPRLIAVRQGHLSACHLY